MSFRNNIYHQISYLEFSFEDIFLVFIPNQPYKTFWSAFTIHQTTKKKSNKMMSLLYIY